jgi:hypothetical protein
MRSAKERLHLSTLSTPVTLSVVWTTVDFSPIMVVQICSVQGDVRNFSIWVMLNNPKM